MLLLLGAGVDGTRVTRRAGLEGPVGIRVTTWCAGFAIRLAQLASCRIACVAAGTEEVVLRFKFLLRCCLVVAVVAGSAFSLTLYIFPLTLYMFPLTCLCTYFLCLFPLFILLWLVGGPTYDGRAPQLCGRSSDRGWDMGHHSAMYDPYWEGYLALI